MTKKELETIPAIKASIKSIQRDLENPPRVRDKVRGSMINYPYIERSIEIEGVDLTKVGRLEKRLKEALDCLQERIWEMENFLNGVADEQMKSILRMKFRENLTDQQIADQLGYERSTITKKLNTFFKG